jgi:hypothetical protein
MALRALTTAPGSQAFAACALIQASTRSWRRSNGIAPPFNKVVQAANCSGNRRTQWPSPENSLDPLDNTPQKARSASPPDQQPAPSVQKQSTPMQEPTQ